MRKILLLLGIIFLLATASVYAVQPSQSYSKIFLDPFYRASMSLNTKYNYTVTINPPDGISSIKSAIITFKAYMTPTVTFNLTVNGQQCNNPLFTVSTTYSGAGQGEISFDCSNRITTRGTYNLVLRPTQANTGAVQGWLDLTYMNNPKGDLSILGTEYSPTDPATIFLQLKDSYGNPVQNGSCYLDIWYPLANGTHPYTLQDAPMLMASGDDGMYYYDMVTPSTLGVYMLSAKCSYTFNWIWFYPETESTYFPVQQINSGTWQGNSQVLNSKTDDLYQRCDGSIALPCSANYTFNLSTYGTITNISNINIYFAGESDISGRLLTMAYWNGTAFISLSNTLNFAGTGTTIPTGYDEFLTNSIPITALINGTIKVRLITAGSVRVFYNWLSIAVLSSAGTIQDLKGSSEMHVTNIPGIIAATNETIHTKLYYINQSINTNIDYTRTNLTTRIDLLETTVSNILYAINSSIITEIFAVPLNVWTYVTRNLTYYPPINATGINVTATIDNDAVAQAVWNATTRDLTYYEPTTINTTAITEEIWNYTARYTHGVVLN